MSYASFKTTFGAKVRELRQAAKMTQPQLADAIEGLDQGGLSRLERGKQGFDSNTLYQIAIGLSVPVYRLFGGEAPQLSDKAISPAAMRVARAWDALGEKERATINLLIKALAKSTKEHS